MLFFENQDIFENLIREIYLIYAEARNNSIEDTNNLCKYIKKLHISEKKLRALVAKVGVNVADVKKELQQERNYSYSR